MIAQKELDLTFVNEEAERIDSAKTIRVDETTLDVGQFLPQGDVALFKLAELPAGAKRIKKPSRQIVEGTTQGSRHEWDSLDGVAVYEVPSSWQSPLVGKIYVLSKERTLTHPEHGHHVYHDGFIGVARFQRQFAEELKRVVD